MKYLLSGVGFASVTCSLVLVFVGVAKASCSVVASCPSGDPVVCRSVNDDCSSGKGSVTCDGVKTSCPGTEENN